MQLKTRYYSKQNEFVFYCGEHEQAHTSKPNCNFSATCSCALYTNKATFPLSKMQLATAKSFGVSEDAITSEMSRRESWSVS